MQSIRKVLKVWRKFVSFLKSCRDALTGKKASLNECSESGLLEH